MEGAREKQSRRGWSFVGARPGGAEEGKGRKKEKETPIGGAQVSATHKKKEKEKGRRAVAGKG
jgi:hypothetical protein